VYRSMLRELVEIEKTAKKGVGRALELLLGSRKKSLERHYAGKIKGLESAVQGAKKSVQRRQRHLGAMDPDKVPFSERAPHAERLRGAVQGLRRKERALKGVRGVVSDEAKKVREARTIAGAGAAGTAGLTGAGYALSKGNKD
jgi:hypothetical protein